MMPASTSVSAAPIIIRQTFGSTCRKDAPRAELADAVAASCAIPGFYHPVTIAGRRYVDGGLYSTSNLDILRGAELDLVICLNPLTSKQEGRRAGRGVAATATGAINGALDFIPSLTRRASRLPSPNTACVACL